MNNVNFVTGTKKVYRLCGNDWYAVEQDDEKVMLVDTDCKVASEELRTTWSCWNDTKDFTSTNNGQYLLNYTNNLVDKYFSSIKHAIIPQDVDCVNEYGEGQGKLKNAYMWAMSKKEFLEHRDIGSKIFTNSKNCIWTRTFNENWESSHYSWYINSSVSRVNINSDNVIYHNSVAPAFYLKKSEILCLTENGEIILEKNNLHIVSEDLLFNAIMCLYDAYPYSYNGLDDKNFIETICENIGITKEKYYEIIR